MSMDVDEHELAPLSYSPLVSVVIPTYNRARCLKESIESVLAQTYPYFEIIVVDDGSTDETQAVVASIDDERVRYIYQENAGACVARNRGIDESRGDYIAFQDSDDIWYSRKLERQAKCLQESDACFCFCGMARTRFDGKQLVDVPQPGVELSLENLLANNYVSTQMLVCKKHVFDHVRFDPEMPRLQDWDLAIQLMERFPFSFCDEILVTQRIGEDSMTLDDNLLASAYDKLLRKHDELYRLHPKAHALMQKKQGGAYERLQQWSSAAGLYSESLRTHFTYRVLYRLLRTRLRRAGERFRKKSGRTRFDCA